LHHEPGTPAVIIYRTDQEQPLDPYTIDHRIVTYLAEAKRNWEQKQTNAGLEAFIKKMEDHDRKVELDVKQQEIELNVELSKFVGQHLRKQGYTAKKHKIDRKKK
jgi:hypothetical protein